MDEACRAFVLRDSKWARLTGSGKEVGSSGDCAMAGSKLVAAAAAAVTVVSLGIRLEEAQGDNGSQRKTRGEQKDGVALPPVEWSEVPIRD